jgi:hypothetical protein
VRAGCPVGLHGGGRERGVSARGSACGPAQGRLRGLVVRAPCRYVYMFTSYKLSDDATLTLYRQIIALE